MSKRILSMALVLIMVLSLLPVTGVAATETTNETQQSSTPAEQAATEPDVKIGVLSDIHVSYDYVDETYGAQTGYFDGVQPGRLEKALRFFKSQGVDAVVIAGDLQESSGTDAATLAKSKVWLQKVVDIWYEVFPEKPGEEGYVEPIFTYGNHDTNLISTQYWPSEWGTYQDVFVKEVNGYSFICTHNAKEELAAPLLEEVVSKNEDKPVFYIQHCPVYNTVPGSTSGYGTGYGQVGWKNVAPYHNVVVLNGHTHAPLTDERSIWQGDGGNEGQFTVLNTATINYTGLANDDLSVNSSNGNAQQTEHGMIISVTGSDVSVDRYSFNDMVFDENTNTTTGDAVKLGETWAWDACDVTDRPYAYDNRVENSAAPEFADDAQITVDSITNTTVQVTVPAASITPTPGFSNMIEGYFVEACNPVTGEMEARGGIATSYHVDDQEGCYTATYTITVNGLNAGTEYLLKVYAQNFYDVKSNVLTTTVTTSGERTYQRTGDINNDGKINDTDLTLLKNIVSAAEAYVAAADVDSNGVLENRDIAALQAILAGGKLTFDSDDLMDKVVEVKLTGASTSANYQPVDYGTIIQNSVVHGNSNQAVKTWATNYAYYPVTTMYFSEPVDLTEYTHLSFDVLFENEYNLSDSYRKRWLSMSFVSGEQEQIATYGSMNFDANGNGWTTATISLTSLKNIDLSAVTAIRFSHNFDYYEGRFNGVTEHAIYWDNIKGVYIEGADSDLLYNTEITGGKAVYGAGYTNHTNHAIMSTGGTLDVIFPDEMELNSLAGFAVQMRTPGTYTVTVQALDANGNPIGKSVDVESYYIYKEKFISTPAMEVQDGVYAKGLRFTYSCEHLLLDDMSAQGSKDKDLIGTADKINPLGGSNCNVTLTTVGTNGSNNALYASAMPGTSVWGGGAELIFNEPLDLSETPYLRFDLKVQNAHVSFYLSLYNSEGELIWTTTHYNANASTGKYATYEFDLRTYRTYEDNAYVYHEVSLDALKDVAKISLTHNLASAPNWTTDDTTALREVWFDNLYACNPLEDLFGAATTLQGPSAVQDGFICEIMPSTSDGHTNVLHWYSDPENNSGTTSAWPGETIVTIQKGVNWLNHSGYDASAYDYLEFTMKNVGNYVAFTFSFLDESGATLGSSNGEYRVSLEEEWTTYRIDLASAGLTADEIAKIHTISMGWNWQYQNANGSEAKKVADIYIDNMGFCSYPEDDIDLLDQVGLIRNSEWWWGGHNTYPGAGWLYQSDITADSDRSFMFYRSAETNGMGYSPRILYAYLTEYVTVESDWVIMLDVIAENFASNNRLELIGSDDKYYPCFTLIGAGEYSLTANISDLIATDGTTAFDPTTTKIKGFRYHTNYNRDSGVSATAGGYLVLDNLWILDPSDVPEPVTLDILESCTSVSHTDEAVAGENFTLELLETFEGRDFVLHQHRVGFTDLAATFPGRVYVQIDVTADAIANAAKYDYFEYELKNTNIYCDHIHVRFYNEAGTKLAEFYQRATITSDWMSYRVDLDTIGLTADEIAALSYIQLSAYWTDSAKTDGVLDPAKDIATKDGDIYIDNMGFGVSNDKSDDLFDSITHIGTNGDWWYSGNNYYDNAGWLMTEDENGSSLFTAYRVKDKTSTSTGYNPRQVKLTFDQPMTLTENDVIAITVTNINMGTGSKLSLIGSDNKRYGALLLNQEGTHTYEMKVSEMVLEGSTTAIDLTTVNIVAVMLHIEMFKGTASEDGTLVFDNLRIGEFATEATEVASDWFYGTSYNAGSYTAAKPYLSIDPKSTDFVNGNLSKYSYKFGYDGGNVDGSIDYWPFFRITFPTNTVDVSGKKLLIDVYVDTEGTSTPGLTLRYIMNTGWSSITEETNIGFTLANNEWTTIEIDFSSLTEKEGQSLAQVHMLDFQVSNTLGVAKYYYFDNARLVDPDYVEPETTEPTTEPTTEATTVPETTTPVVVEDLLDAATKLNYGWWTTEKTNNSTTSWKITNEDFTLESHGWFYPTITFDKGYAIAGYDLVFDVYVEGVSGAQLTMATLNGDWVGNVSINGSTNNLGLTVNGWTTVTMRLDQHTNGDKDLITEMVSFAPGINLSEDGDGVFAVYIDNMRLVAYEDVTNDLIHTSIDKGESELTYELTDEKVYGVSSKSMKLDNSASDAFNSLCLNPETQWGLDSDQPKFLEQFLTGYFYFGDQEPSAYAVATMNSWKSTQPNYFVFEDVGDGWYFGYVHLMYATCNNGGAAFTADWRYLNRLYIYIPAGYTVYVDQLKLQGDCDLDNMISMPIHGDSSDDITTTLDNEHTYNGNIASLKVTNAAAAEATMLYDFDVSMCWIRSGHYVNLSYGGTLNMVVYFGDQDPKMNFKVMDDTWRGFIAKAITFTELGDGWYSGTLDISSFSNWDSEFGMGAALDTIKRFQFCIPAGYTVWFDSISYTLGEKPTEDQEAASDLLNGATIESNTSGSTVTVDTEISDPENSLRSWQLHIAKLGTGSMKLKLSENHDMTGGITFDVRAAYANGSAATSNNASIGVTLYDESGNALTSVIPAEVAHKQFYNVTLDAYAYLLEGKDLKAVRYVEFTLTAPGTDYNAWIVVDGFKALETYNPLEDLIANYTDVKGPTVVQENFVCEYLAETDDGHTDVIHLHATTDGGLTTSNWPGVTEVYTSAVPASVDTTVYDYVEFTYKHYGVKYAFYINFFDASGTALGTGSEIRTSNESGWATHRVDLATAGLTAEEIAKISYFTLSISWEYNNANGSYLQEGEMWFDNIRFGSVNDESTDLLDHVVRTYLSAGATAKYLGSDWGWNDDGAFVITRDTTSANWTSLQLYFDEALTVESDWVLSCDFDITNFHHGGSIAIIGSDGATYSSIGPNKGGTNTVSKVISEFATSAGVAFDPTTVTITGIHLSYSLGTSNNVTDTTVGGYMSLDNLTLTDPTPAE